MGVFIGIILVLAAMNIFFIFVLKGIVARIGKFAQSNVLRQAGILDALIQSKEQHVEMLNQQLQEASRDAQGEYKPGAKNAKTIPADFLSIPHGVYKDPLFHEEYKEIRKNFSFDHAQCVKNVADMASPSEETAHAKRIVEDMSGDVIFNLSTMEGEEQVSVLKQALDYNQKLLLDAYMNQLGSDEFKTYEFIAWLKQYIFTNSPDVIVRTGDGNTQLEEIAENVTVQRDSGICEGLYMISRGKFYDFSIRNREIVG